VSSRFDFGPGREGINIAKNLRIYPVLFGNTHQGFSRANLMLFIEHSRGLFIGQQIPFEDFLLPRRDFDLEVGSAGRRLSPPQGRVEVTKFGGSVSETLATQSKLVPENRDLLVNQRGR